MMTRMFHKREMRNGAALTKKNMKSDYRNICSISSDIPIEIPSWSKITSLKPSTSSTSLTMSSSSSPAPTLTRKSSMRVKTHRDSLERKVVGARTPMKVDVQVQVQPPGRRCLRRFSNSRGSCQQLAPLHSDGDLNGVVGDGDGGNGRKQNSRVMFSIVEIREYSRIMGDNPSCSGGAPISLDWDHNHSFSLDLDEYEGKKKRRSFDELRIPRQTRHDILLDECGYSMSTIMKVALEVKTARNQRAKTSQDVKRLLKTKDAITSITRCLSQPWTSMLCREKKSRTQRDEDDNSCTSLGSTSESNEDIFDEGVNVANFGSHAID